MILRNVEVDGASVDVRVRDGRIVEVGRGLAGTLAGDDVHVDGRGGALLPGMHDHHLHLLATAAAQFSTSVGPPEVNSAESLRRALSRAPLVGGWVRAVGYDVVVAGDLDRHRLDALRADVPVRVQHRSGALWMLNSRAVVELGLDDVRHPGVERDHARRPTGRLWRADDLLAELPRPAPDLRPVGNALAAFGVTGVTDATPSMTAATAELIARAHCTGALPQRVTLLAHDLTDAPPGVTLGPAKLVVADHEPPGWDTLVDQVRSARASGRAVAVHCVTRESLLLTLAVLAEVGSRPGDRIEHAAVAPPEAIALAVAAGVRVVTQPSLVARRGADYLDRVAPEDTPWLWPWASMLAAGVPVAGSSDAPYGDLDPWAGVRSAVARAAPDGRVVAASERVDPGTALAGWLGAADDPGGPMRRVVPGAPADLVLLSSPLTDALNEPSAERVRLTMIAGAVVHEREPM